ncbi:glycosyltransferase family 2 protein [Russula earlei]|uniref:Glycosyltransferase family 2 protein n=1 Tax=Russula earlei TaxID=71964 RepID=A0ACC0U046_9AGAM|nr:glycosyltransferase family 2 protein [Russula earlei]
MPLSDPFMFPFRRVCGPASDTSVLMFCSQGYLVLLAWTPPPLYELPSEKHYCAPKDPKTPHPLPSIRDAASLDLSIIIPAYNETQRLPSMLSSTLEHLASFPKRTFEILIIDDGSSDGTATAALRLAADHYPKADVRVVQLERNRGKGGAVRHGMLHARGRRLLMADADGASRFADVELLLSALDALAPAESDAAGIAIGSRAHLVNTEAVVKRSLLRNFLMYGLHTVLRLVGVGHIRDTQCGFKLFSREAARALFPRQHLATWIFDVELLLLAKSLRIPVAEVPVTWHEVAGSKLSVARDSLQMLRDLLVLRANQLLGRWSTMEERLKAE